MAGGALGPIELATLHAAMRSRSGPTLLAEGWQRFGPDVFHRVYLDAEMILLDPDYACILSMDP